MPGNKAKPAGIGGFQERPVFLGDAADGQGIAPVRGEFRQRVYGRLEVPGADGEGEKGHVLIPEFCQEPPVHGREMLAESPVPHVDVAEIVVCRA